MTNLYYGPNNPSHSDFKALETAKLLNKLDIFTSNYLVVEYAILLICKKELPTNITFYLYDETVGDFWVTTVDENGVATNLDRSYHSHMTKIMLERFEYMFKDEDGMDATLCNSNEIKTDSD